MIWQFVALPGTHTVTVVNKVLTSGVVLVGPASTTTSATLAPVGVEPPDPDEPLPLPLTTTPPPPPPPQESTGQQRAAHSPKRQARDDAPMEARLFINANLL